MLRLVGPFITCLLALASTPAIAQAGATRPSASGEEAAQRTEGQEQPASAPSVTSELCHTLEQAAAETPEASASQANALSATSPAEVVQKSVAVSTDSQGRVSDDVEPNVRAGELTDNARLPTTLLLYLALGLAVVGILSFAFLKLFKNETNKTLASDHVTEIAACMALRLGRDRDRNGEFGDSQQADAFVLNEVGCADDSEEPAGGTAPTPTSHNAKLAFNEYRQRVEACLNWAKDARAERVACLTLADAWLRAALADLADAERNNKSEQGLGLQT